MQTAKTGDTVQIDYVVKTNDGNVVGDTSKIGPQTLKIGDAQFFPEVEQALDGMSVGSEGSVTVPAEKAFGPRREEMVITIPRAQLPQDQAPEPQMTIAAQQQDGSTINLVITKVTEESVVADGNHPLAGEDLHFSLRLVDIKDAA